MGRDRRRGHGRRAGKAAKTCIEGGAETGNAVRPGGGPCFRALRLRGMSCAGETAVSKKGMAQGRGLLIALVGALCVTLAREVSGTAGDNSDECTALCAAVSVARGAEQTAKSIAASAQLAGADGKTDELNETTLVLSFAAAEAARLGDEVAASLVATASDAEEATATKEALKASVKAARTAKTKAQEAEKAAVAAIYGDKVAEFDAAEQNHRGLADTTGTALAFDISNLCDTAESS
ncbi:hypothetical protein, conserved in T. vivax [Trypanosoma vivax Y486]|uniref:Uncharacterized protein n=1 Tax=Trypanosoma vivax (strain Y486) TaxID=1055687 RepID=F9WMK3_TRYVY|nr:hypothetical protein, conserved in T. vivax [Trypanosoma vivax Y486]|eukprot:CCD18760.1 hypothetical protein, conserved in T. vivax [Trypanosoma vivax Y486]